MEEHPIQGLMTTAMENLKDMVEVNTIIGDPIESPDGSVIIPVSKLGFGFAAGGTEYGSSKEEDSSMPFGGGSGGGVSITPVAFLIVTSKGVKMVHLDESTHIYEKMIDFAPKAVEKIQELLQTNNSHSKNHLKGRTKDRDGSNEERQPKRRKKQSKEKSEERGLDKEEFDDFDDEMDYEI